MQRMYVLHSRPYRETSLLLDCLSEANGRVSLIARGAKRPKSPFKNILQPFIPLLADWTDRGELHTLKHAETIGRSPDLLGRQLFSALYLNELLINLLHKHDPVPSIFYLYQQAIQSELHEVNLRYFEKRLLDELGYALQLTQVAHSDDLVHEDQHYMFNFDYGVNLAPVQVARDLQKLVFKGKSLQAIAHEDFSREETRKDAKRLMRLAFNHLLNGKKLKTRELFNGLSA